MSIRVALHHSTVYKYDRPIFLGPHIVRLRPAPHSRTPITAYSLKVTPAEHFVNWQQDPFGNYQARFVFNKPTRELKVEVDLVAEMTTINPFDFFIDEAAEFYPFAYDEALAKELAPYRETKPWGGRFGDMVGKVKNEIAKPQRRCIDVLVEVNRLVQETLKYDIRMEPGVFTPEETLTRGHGSCRDFAWLMVQLLRQLGFGARFVSGYSIQLKADKKPLEGPAGVTEDCTDLHAWAEVFLPGAGWIGLDATSGLLAAEGHIPLACTAEPSTAAAIFGSFGWDSEHDDDKLNEEFKFTMRVDRIEDRPRSTKPYTEEQWAAIVTAGDAVDAALNAADVRLTMGGEPTFVSVDDMEGAEWNTTAMGPAKEKLSDELLRRLQKRFAEGSFLHHGQGKWYPGEPLPRWAYSIYYRKDGEPVWTHPELFADAKVPGKAGPEEAKLFVDELAQRLAVPSGFAIPGYEDTWYYLWRERRLPANVDPFDAKLENEEDRKRLRQVFDQGLQKVVGYALPLRAVYETDTRFRWVSGKWFLRAERMYLMPGDSAMGFRLPLDSLPWSKPGDMLYHFEQDPTERRSALPPRAQWVRQTPDTSPPRDRRPTPVPPSRGESAVNVTRTALCVEPRNGMLHVFMPPATRLEEYLDLVTNIEETALALKVPLRIEGYHPPSDHRLGKISVTPDPGVIEVNIHPATSWREVVDHTSALYEEAHQTRLGTEKFMVDGRHTGTGGGNHLVLGGATPTDSPFLRRPDLLRSFVSYWVNHPSLSYLFSGLFVGPTSQAPRIDEARHDTLDEIEIAFGQLENWSSNPPPWIVDRLFRNILTDVTGNTHRTEMCIDKMYSPDSATGRQGLLELRAFEMPPDARMSCAQQLLVRALTAWFWNEPYRRKLVRWGTSLHDKFMLPHFAAQDFDDILNDLSNAGFKMDRSWFAPHYEFRFPIYGRVNVRGVEVELRQAIEPWHVLGEEAGGGGAVRYVDSSVERVEVKVRNMTDPRHVVLCNGRRVPLTPTGTNGEYVAGVRYKAWGPAAALHPTINIHTPLTFDVLDTWSQRSVGGCTYHVAHPGGRNYDRFPANGLEAQSRRVNRFFAMGHTPGPMAEPPAEPNPRFPLTLDLRYPGPLR
ncbi:MAG: transglutaminase family protein [Deltaproteobacteria bacterium]|nr:transglutaminase family protein [Deltaproteobacteria bacterium]